ncbi:MAG TPA: tetratricopeptide repeat protein [Methylomirabilota bacterium]|nr:tetratricopeptide repeat protein [Methylomirabilota bacterium]
MTSFSTHEVAKILGLPDSKIRSCARAGLLAPARGRDGRLRWSFQDLLLLKTTRGLLDARVPARRVRRMLASLRRQLPGDQALSSLTIFADGRRVVAWDGTARWQPDSGQFLFNFDAHAVAEHATPAPARTTPAATAEPASRTAEEWFDLAGELETASPDEARHAYQQALALDPALADAHVNLGRLCHQAGEAARAETHYRAAIQLAPRDPIARFNLAGLLEETQRAAEAVESYRHALAVDPEFADAHYNLGLLLDSLGRRAGAMTHLRTARRLYGRRSA